jgi:hypothetical protein
VEERRKDRRREAKQVIGDGDFSLLAPGDFFSRAINIAGLTKRWRKLIFIDDEATGRGSDDDAGWTRAILIGYRWIAVSFDTIRYDTLIVRIAAIQTIRWSCDTSPRFVSPFVGIVPYRTIQKSMSGSNVGQVLKFNCTWSHKSAY